VGRSCRTRRSRGRARIVPISRPCLSFVFSWCPWIKALLGRRHPGALAASKRRAIWVVLLALGTLVSLRAGVVRARLLSARLLHLLPCCEDIRARLGIFCPRVWPLRGGWSTEILVCEAVGATCIGGILLWWGRPWLLRRGFGWGRAIVRSTLGRCSVRVARWRWRSRSWGIRRVAGNVLAAVLSPLRIVLCSLQLIAEDFVCGLDLLELDDKLSFAPRVPIWMVL
jgi:hypothetical protein